MHRAVKVKALDNYLILVRFDDGKEKVYNCYPHMELSMYSNFRDKEKFTMVRVDDMGLVCWDSATDLDPYVLYYESIDVSEFKF